MLILCGKTRYDGFPHFVTLYRSTMYMQMLFYNSQAQGQGAFHAGSKIRWFDPAHVVLSHSKRLVRLTTLFGVL